MNILQENETLNSGLSEFGLCPSDWLIIKEDDCVYKIENIEEPHFFFKGSISFENGRKKWGSIHLAGL